MNIYEALDHLRQGKIARCKYSYFAIDPYGYLVRINKKELTVKGIAVVEGDIFATEDWELIDKRPIYGEDYNGFYNS
jgi:hypothetical protein